MGILAEPAQMVMGLMLGNGFSVCELGDQYVTYVSPRVLAPHFYKSLGCAKYVSIDANGRGTITADLNRPINGLGQFDLVTDFGTGEHVFNQAQVWKTVHDLTKPKGYIAFDRPMQGYEGHCFYNTHECLFRDLAAANEYEVVNLERGTTKRGELMRGVFRKVRDVKFRMPYQGRYRKSSKL
jgi:hypothetical protein